MLKNQKDASEIAVSVVVFPSDRIGNVTRAAAIDRTDLGYSKVASQARNLLE